MKKTSKDFIQWLGLQVGDRVKIKFEISNAIDETIITEERIVNIVSDNNLGVGLEHDGVVVPIERLLNKDFDILPRPKRVGDLKCETDIECDYCPLKAVCAMYTTFERLSLYEVLEKNNTLAPDQEIHDLLKARLDKEVLEDESN